MDYIELPASADMHVHLRDDAMMRAVVPTIRQGGVDIVYVMPNLLPPLTTVSLVLSYHRRLQALAPDVTFLMSLYLHATTTPAVIREAKAAGIRGVKSYPAGLTTNSESGVVDYESFYDVFEEMERCGLVLNLHGEVPSGEGVSVLTAEEQFLPILLDLHARFPALRIVLEHCSTAAAIEAVKSCGPNVAGGITAHHLSLVVDNVVDDAFNYCKPVAKTPADRNALLLAATSGNPKFFLGTDSAPHPSIAKRGGPDGKAKHAAGVFTQPYATQYVLDAFQSGVDQGILNPHVLEPVRLAGFLGEFGRDFYREPRSLQRIRVSLNQTDPIRSVISLEDKIEVVSFRREQMTRKLEWI